MRLDSATAVAHGRPLAFGSVGLRDTSGALLQAASGSHSGLLISIRSQRLPWSCTHLATGECHCGLSTLHTSILVIHLTPTPTPTLSLTRAPASGLQLEVQLAVMSRHLPSESGHFVIRDHSTCRCAQVTSACQ
jgi:hypothetical protein